MSPSPLAIDLVLLALVAAAAVAGALGGALRQLVQLLAAVGAWWLARLLAPRAAALASSSPGPVLRGAAAVVLFVVLVVALGLLGRLLLRLARGGDGQPGSLDRAGGALLGGAKAFLVLWVILSALVLPGQPLTLGSFRLDLRGSDFGALAARHNLLEGAASGATEAVERLLHGG